MLRERLFCADGICLRCRAVATKLCTTCKRAWYCSKECQRDHRDDHRRICGRGSWVGPADATKKMRKLVAAVKAVASTVDEVVAVIAGIE